MMKRMKVLVVLLILTVLFTGCGNTQESFQRDIMQIQEDMTEAGEELPEEAPERTAAEDEKKLTQEIGSGRSSAILEDEKAIYLCGRDRICKINKEDNTSQTLWESEGGVEGVDLYRSGSALLIRDKIYFIENLNEPDYEKPQSALSVIGTDGSNHQRLAALKDYTVRLFWEDHILYVSSYYVSDVYEIFADGSLQKTELVKVKAEYEKILRQNEKKQLVYVKGEYLSLPECLEAFGYFLILNDASQLVKIEPETGAETIVAQKGSLAAYNENYLVLSYYENERINLYLTDVNTLETSLLIECELDFNVFDMDENYIYAGRIDYEKGKYVYERVSLETAECQKIFEQDKVLGMDYDYMEYNFTPRIQNGFLYYINARDYQMYVMRRDPEHPETEEKVGEAFYNSRIGEVGMVERYEEKIYSQIKPDFWLTEISIERLVVDDCFPGAEKINQLLIKELNNDIIYAKSNVDYLEEELAAGNEGYWSQYSLSGRLAGVSYFDGSYLSFCQQFYDYQGGAHGMPYWIGYTFDLQTGNRLYLKDLLGNSEAELKDIVTENFAGYINQNPEAFWPDAIDSVREWIDFDSSFYLTDEGIMFYFGPYALASYAAGFQSVVIPYGEFEMRIPTEQ